MPRENWKLQKEADPRNRPRFVVVYDCPYWKHPCVVARLNNRVSEEVAGEVMELLMEKVGHLLDRQAEQTRQWRSDAHRDERRRVY